MEKWHIEQNLMGIHHGRTQQKDLGLTRHFMQQEEEASVEKRIKRIVHETVHDV